MWKSGSRPRYSAMGMKLGETIVSVTPSPAPKPLANWVLPAPRSPTRLIRSPGRATTASAAASACVAAASRVSTTRSGARPSIIGGGYPIASDEALQIAHRDDRGSQVVAEANERCFEANPEPELVHPGRAEVAPLSAGVRPAPHPHPIGSDLRQRHVVHVEDEHGRVGHDRDVSPRQCRQ